MRKVTFASRHFLLLILCCWIAPAWARLPLEFVSLPDISDMALGQSQTLTYTIRNNVQTQNLPLRRIVVINDGDKQPDSSVRLTSTCGALLAPNATCAITVILDQAVSGALKRYLSIDYNGRAPLVSRINLQVAPAAYTMLIYIVGSDLESNQQTASFNINQMTTVGSTNNMNIILETGGSNAPGWRTVKRQIVLPGKLELIQDLGQVNMGLTTTVQDFIEWGMKMYPAERYILIFNDHGGGPNGGFGGDELFNQSATPINQLVAATAAASTKVGKKFEIIGFDACLLAGGEILSGLFPYTNYYLASEDLEPGSGWQYNTFLNFVNTYPQADGLAIGAQIINGYTEQNERSSTTLSLLVSADTPPLVTAIDNFSIALNPHVNNMSGWKAIAKGRFKAADYATSVWDNRSYDLVDLTSFSLAMGAQFPQDTSLQSAVSVLVDAINKAVAYFKNSVNRSDSYGLTLYFPSILGAYKEGYPNVTKLNGNEFFSANYISLVTNYHDFYVTNASSLLGTPNNLAYDGINYTATINNDYNELFAAVGNNDCNFTIYNENNVPLPNVPCYSALQFSGINSVAGIPPSWNISFNRLDNENNWPLANGIPVLLIPEDAVPQEDTFLIPVTRKENTKITGYLNVVKTGDTYNVTGFQQNQGSSNTLAKIVEIKSGEEFFLRAYTFSSSTWALRRSNLIIKAPFTINFGPVTAPDFSAFRFLVSDLTGALIITSTSEPY